MRKPSPNHGERIRVLQVVPSFVMGGAERCVVQLMCELDSSRFEVAALSLYARQSTDLETILAERELKVTFLQKQRGLDLALLAPVLREVQNFRPHVIHTHLHAFNYVIPVIMRHKTLAFVHTVHSIAEREQRRLGKWLPKLFFSRAVVPVAIAREVQNSIRLVFGVDSILIPNGIPLGPYSSPSVSRSHWRQLEGFGPDDVIFVCVGRLECVKNHQMLINAFALVSSRAPNARLLLVGDGELRTELRTQVETLNLDARVHFVGIQHDIPSILKACDVYVFASDQEGSPLSVMEAMAAGLPIVGTRVGGVPEMVPSGKAGLLSETRRPDSLAASMTSLYHNAEQRVLMGRSAAEHAAAFDVTRMADGYGNLYARLLGHLA